MLALSGTTAFPQTPKELKTKRGSSVVVVNHKLQNAIAAVQHFGFWSSIPSRRTLPQIRVLALWSRRILMMVSFVVRSPSTFSTGWMTVQIHPKTSARRSPVLPARVFRSYRLVKAVAPVRTRQISLRGRTSAISGSLSCSPRSSCRLHLRCGRLRPASASLCCGMTARLRLSQRSFQSLSCLGLF